MAAFSTTDEAILTAPLELNPLAQSATASSSGRSIYDIYDIRETAAKIHAGRFQRIALQFPDEALIDSVPVFWALKKEISSIYDSAVSSSSTPALPELYILADTSYGSCCVDEVAARHVDADLVVHYGHACLSTTVAVPVIYVFTKQVLPDELKAVEALASLAQNHLCKADDVKALVLTYDVAWDYIAEQVYQKLAEKLSLPVFRTYVDTKRNYEGKMQQRKDPTQTTTTSANCVESSCCQTDATTCSQGTCCRTTSSTPIIPPPQTPIAPPAEESIKPDQHLSPLGPSRKVDLPPGLSYSDCGYLYLGPESLSLTNLLLTLGPTSRLVSYNPLTGTGKVETGSTNKLLMKRYTSVLKARDASVVGLLVGTLGVHSYLPLLKHLRKLLTSRASGRKVYTISVGKLNPAKLANFQEIDVFVLIACPENTLIDSKEFYKPIVTPFEMELAIRANQRHSDTGEEGVDWTGEYKLDLEQLVPPDVISSLEELTIDPNSVEQNGTHDDSDDDGQPHFSLISGKYVQRRKFNPNDLGKTTRLPVEADNGERSLMTTAQNNGGTGDSVALRNKDGTLTTVLQSASMAHLDKREWKGLEQRIGMDEPSQLEEGREGIARGYKDAGGQGHTM